MTTIVQIAERVTIPMARRRRMNHFSGNTDRPLPEFGSLLLPRNRWVHHDPRTGRRTT
jgi:hypothetical protein